MTFRVEPQDLRSYAAQLADAMAAAEVANSYVNRLGSFSLHEQGAIGFLFPGHSNYMDALNQMLTHLAAVTDASELALRQMAAEYEQSDQHSAARLDGSYPETPRPPSNHEAQERNTPRPPRNVW